MLLVEAREDQAALVHPGQELQSDADAALQVTVGGGRVADGGRSLAGSSQREPVREGASQVGVRGGLVRELVLQPARDAFEILVALLQDAAVHEKLADVTLVPGGREFVQQLVGERVALGREAGEELGVRTFLDPLDDGER
ncbi:hypothetical protein ACFY4H_22535 [Streptomyces althioticus]|uniref:hypothetical protein n=1 Tax=Streptomyces althioticus TaxID=83380 RepID=UPI0036813FD5